MNLIETIKDTIKPELELFDKTLVRTLDSDNLILESINAFIFQQSGKKLRPMLVILASKIISGEISDATIQSAIAMELLHTASLVHDDVVDDTLERRGTQSVNARWGNKVAVLSGDYMLSTGLMQVALTQNIDILRLVSFIGMQLSDGEILQLSATQQAKVSESQYLKIIQKKTAYLFSVCAGVGAYAVGASQKEVEHLKKFGEYLGLCFQIKDDIFDYLQDVNIGKPTGNDIRDGKVTLPLIYALKNASEDERARMIAWIRMKEFSQENIDYLNKFAIENGGLEYAEKTMLDYKEKAIRELDDFENNPWKQALIQCAEFAVSRNK